MQRKLSDPRNFCVLGILAITVCLCILHCNCKIFEPCELGTFFLNQDIPYDKVGDWVCLAHASSSYNSSFLTGMYNNPWHNLQYGIFQIGNYWFCVDEWKPTNNDCHLNCTSKQKFQPGGLIFYGQSARCSRQNQVTLIIFSIELLDDDLTDDLKCARLIYRRKNYTFDDFYPFKASCSSNSSENHEKYIGNCDFANGSPPQILNNETNVNFYLNEIKPEVEALSCEVNGSLPIKITWQKNFEILKLDDPLYKVETISSTSYSLVTSKLYFTHTLKFLTPDMKLTYWKCTGKNKYGDKSQDFFVRIYDPPLPPTPENTNLLKQFLTIGISSIVTAMLIVTICVAVYKFWLRKRVQFTKDEIREFEDGTSIPIGETNYAFMYEKFRSDPYNKGLEISINDLTIHGNKCLGSGEFGEVYLGEYKGTKIAVKTSQKARINENSKDYIRSLLTEIKVLSYVRGHRNIIELLGAYTKELRKGKVYVLAEFCPYGSLKTQLKKYRLTKGNSYKTVEQVEDFIDLQNKCPKEDDDEKLEPVEINHKVMINWATQITAGMEWLGLKNVVHGDLATRNVLLLSPDIVKITDFGLSIKLYNYRMKQADKNTKIPWRWMSVETLRELILSPQGDVWSFGICLWEIFSFAQKPYSGILDYNLDIFNQIENGTLRNPQPPDTPKPVYDIMADCWKTNPSERPTFTLLRERLFLEARKFSAPTMYVDFNELSMN